MGVPVSIGCKDDMGKTSEFFLSWLGKGKVGKTILNGKWKNVAIIGKDGLLPTNSNGLVGHLVLVVFQLAGGNDGLSFTSVCTLV